MASSPVTPRPASTLASSSGRSLRWAMSSATVLPWASNRSTQRRPVIDRSTPRNGRLGAAAWRATASSRSVANMLMAVCAPVIYRLGNPRRFGTIPERTLDASDPLFRVSWSDPRIAGTFAASRRACSRIQPNGSIRINCGSAAIWPSR